LSKIILAVRICPPSISADSSAALPPCSFPKSILQCVALGANPRRGSQMHFLANLTRGESISIPVLFVSVCSAIAWADSTNDPYQKLSHARSLKCLFSTVIQSTWEAGKFSTKTNSETFELHFDSIDSNTHKARLIGNNGAADVSVLLTPESLSFIEVTPSGNPNFTTVFPSLRAGASDFIAVSSRHVSIFGPFPSQHHGTCKIWE
jgi:hypothetical protein